MSFCSKIYLTASSQRTYGAHQRLFISICEIFEWEPLLLVEPELCRVVAHFTLGHTVNSVPSFLSAVQNLWDVAGAGKLPRGPVFKLFLRGLQRLLGAADEVVRIRALEFPHVIKIIAALSWDSPVDVCFGAQLLTAFFLALRTEDHTGGRLLWGDVYPQAAGHLEFRLPPGKSTRTFSHVMIAARADTLDVRTWLRRLAYFVPLDHRSLSHPVFVSFQASRDGTLRFPAVSRASFIYRLKIAVKDVLGFDPTLYAGYSLRRGGVTALIAAGVPAAVIKRHVRWAPMSEALNAYYDHSGVAQMLLPTQAI